MAKLFAGRDFLLERRRQGLGGKQGGKDSILGE